jgi:hypothetical protein
MAVRKVVWVIDAGYRGYDLDYDRCLEDIIGRLSDGAGWGFGGRDISWSFCQGPAALLRAKLLKQEEGSNLISLALRKMDNESWDILEEIILI